MSVAVLILAPLRIGWALALREVIARLILALTVLMRVHVAAAACARIGSTLSIANLFT